MNTVHFDDVPITVFDQTIRMPLNQPMQENLLSETASDVNNIVNSKNVFDTVDTGYKSMKSLSEKTTKLNDVINNIHKHLESADRDILIATIFCFISLALITAAVASLIIAITVLSLPASIVATATFMTIYFLSAFGTVLFPFGAAALGIHGVSYENMGDSIWIAMLLPPLAKFVQVFSNFSALESEKEQLTTDIQKDIVNLMQLFTTDNLQFLKNHLEDEILIYNDITLPTEEETSNNNKNLTRLKELKEIETLIESIRKQLSKYSSEEMNVCAKETILERIPKEIFSLMGNQLLIN